MDIGFGGSSGDQQQLYVGFLIRSVQQCWPVEGSGGSEPSSGMQMTFNNPCATTGGKGGKAGATSMIEGPCLVVDALLRAGGAESIKAMVQAKTGRTTMTAFEPQSESHPVINLIAMSPTSTLVQPAVLSAPRVGLVPRTMKDMLFGGRNYRLFTVWDKKVDSTKLAKQRCGVIASALFRQMKAHPSLASCFPLDSERAKALVKSLTTDKELRGVLVSEAQSVSGGTGKNCEAILDGMATAWKALTVQGKEEAFMSKAVLGQDVLKADVMAAIVAHAALQGCV